MKNLAIICILFVIITVSSEQGEIHRFGRSPAQQYTTKYDNINIDSILQSKRLLISYINCLLDKGPCAPEGRELKKLLPDALSSNCSKCSPVQKTQAGKVLTHVLLNYRTEWEMLLAKYDPNGTYLNIYESQNEDYSDLDEARR